MGRAREVFSLPFVSPMPKDLLVVIPAVGLGLLGSYPMMAIALLGLACSLFLALAGQYALLSVAVLLSGVSFNFLGGDSTAIGGTGLDGARLAIVLCGFGFAVLRRPSLLLPARRQWLYLAFLVYTAVTLLWSPSQGDGVRLLAKLIYPVVIYLLALEVIRERGEGAAVALLGGAVVVAAAVNVTVGALGLSPWAGGGYEGRFGGASHPNTIGMFCATSGLMLYAYLGRANIRWVLPLIILSVIQLVATGSRTAIVAGGLALLTHDLLRRRLGRVVMFAFVGAALWLLVPTLGNRTVSEGIDAGLSPSVLGSGLNFSGRFLLWGDVWTALMGDGQVLGKGLGATDLFFSTRYTGLQSVHNGYLLLLIDVGLVGLTLALGYFVVRAIGCAVRARGEREWGAALTASLVVSFLVATVVESTFAGHAYPTLLWLGFALTDRVQSVHA